MAKGETARPPRYQDGSRYYRILEQISAGDMFVGFLLSAGSTRLMYRTAYERARDRYENRRAIERLERCGYVERKTSGDTSTFFATKEGKIALNEIYERSERATKHPQKWDGKWRMVVYDFPESKRASRDELRNILKRSRFLNIQKSVWIYPFESLALNKLFARDPSARAYTVFIIASRLTAEKKYKKHFKITK